MKAVVCLADGGRLLLGVEDDGTVVGARPRHGDHTDGARLAALVANKTTPSVAVDMEVVHTRSGQVCNLCTRSTVVIR
ncbi:MAG: AlbA family DNA-binding domain-containing protein [Acidimicrobiales bacterium]